MWIRRCINDRPATEDQTEEKSLLSHYRVHNMQRQPGCPTHALLIPITLRRRLNTLLERGEKRPSHIEKTCKWHLCIVCRPPQSRWHVDIRRMIRSNFWFSRKSYHEYSLSVCNGCEGAIVLNCPLSICKLRVDLMVFNSVLLFRMMQYSTTQGYFYRVILE